VTDGATVTGKMTITAGSHSQTIGADDREYLVGQPVKEVVHITKGRRSAHDIVEHQRFSLEALAKSVNTKPTLELQEP